MNEGHIEAQHMYYEPWTDGYAVGFKCTDLEGRVSYIYLNPSSEDSDEGPNVFLYWGEDGNPATDTPIEWHATDWHVCKEDNPSRAESLRAIGCAEETAAKNARRESCE